MLENKFDTLKKESSNTNKKLSESVLVLEHDLLETKENYHQTIKTLESDIHNYEVENRQLQRSVDAAKRSSVDLYALPSHEGVRRTPSQQMVDEESSLLVLHHNKVLKTALDEVASENTHLKRRIMTEQLRELKPLVVGSNSRAEEESNQSDSEKSLYKQYSRVKSEICHLEASPRVVDLTGGSKGVQEYCRGQVDSAIKRTQLARECEDLKQKIALLAASMHKGALIETEASSFVQPGYAKSLDSRKIGSIHVPSVKGISRNITTNIDNGILRKLLFVTC